MRAEYDSNSSDGFQKLVLAECSVRIDIIELECLCEDGLLAGVGGSLVGQLVEDILLEVAYLGAVSGVSHK